MAFEQLGNLSPEQTQGLLSMAAALLQAGGPSTRPVGFGQAFGGGLQAYQQGVEAAQDRSYQRQLRGMQMDEAQASAAEKKRSRELQASIDAAARASVVSPESAALAAGGGPTMVNAQALANGPQQNTFDTEGFLSRVTALDPLRAAEYSKALAKAGAEFDTKINFLNGPNGEAIPVLIGKQGQVKRLEGYTPREEMKLLNLGGKEVAYNPFGLAAGQAFNRTASPDAMLSAETARRGQNMTDARAREFNANQRGAAPKMTEDQAKATGWLVQAQQAYNNLSRVAFDDKGNIRSAAKPGAADALASLPFGLSAVGNSLRSEDRQKFVQSASSLSEALLRAATGAGVNRDEAAQKIAELTPQFGDSEAVIRQKFDAIPSYLQSLQVRAGPGAPQARSIVPTSAPGGEVKFLGFE
jgi:hypothetical protein